MPRIRPALVYVLIGSIGLLGSLACLDTAPDANEGSKNNAQAGTGGPAPGCDPLAQDCPDSMGCYIGGADALFECQATTWAWSEGEACEQLNDCAPGLYCAPWDLVSGCAAGSCCTSYCDRSVSSACAGNGTCASFFDDTPPPGFENVGVCVGAN